jgi:outer membrane lipoprotein-sorting protein
MRWVLALAWLSCATPAWAQWNVTQLFGMLAKDRPGKATFHERRFLALLDRPVEATGELAFTPPDTMEKRTITPRPERVLVDRERVTLERAGKRHSLGLRENPAVAVLVESIRATLAGDLEALTRVYSVALEGTAAKWRLTLRPLDPAAAQLVERIDISGEQARVRTVEIRQADGDRSVMTITPVAP